MQNAVAETPLMESYRVNLPALKKFLSDTEEGFLTHVIQEGVKQLVFGNGPIEVHRELQDAENPNAKNGSIRHRLLTTEMTDLLRDLDIIYTTNIKIGSVEVLEDWNYNGLSDNANFFGTQRDWNCTLQTKLKRMMGHFVKSQKMKPNALIVPHKYVALIEDLTGFHNTSSFHMDGKVNQKVDLDYLSKPIGTVDGMFVYENIADDGDIISMTNLDFDFNPDDIEEKNKRYSYEMLQEECYLVGIEIKNYV